MQRKESVGFLRISGIAPSAIIETMDKQKGQSKSQHRMMIDYLEKRLQSLVEDNLSRLFGGNLKPQTLIRKLVRALEDALLEEDDQLVAPNQFTIFLSPSNVEQLLSQDEHITTWLAEQLLAVAYESHIFIHQMPQITLVNDQNIPDHQVVIETEFSNRDSETTDKLDSLLDGTGAGFRVPKATLMLNDREIALAKKVINIGRRRDNHIVIDQQTISRYHCQLRLRFGRYVVYDLHSKSGVFVNGMRIQEHILQSGDTIGLGVSCQLVYVEDNSTLSKGIQDTDTDVLFTSDE